MNSNEIKTLVMGYYRFNRQMISADEVSIGGHVADVVVYTGAFIHEIEIKISKSDLWRDTKKSKHKLYKIGWHRYLSVPNLFSVCVPVHLEAEAKLWCKEVNPKYGVVRVDNLGYMFDRVTVARAAKPLHDTVMHKCRESIVRRLNSALIVCYKQKYWKVGLSTKETNEGI